MVLHDRRSRFTRLEISKKTRAPAQRELYNRYSPKMYWLSAIGSPTIGRTRRMHMLQEGFIKVFSQMHTLSE